MTCVEIAKKNRDVVYAGQVKCAWIVYVTTMAFRDVLQLFSDHTTMHGVPKVINAKSTLARVFWSFVCLAAGAMFGLQMTEVRTSMLYVYIYIVHFSSHVIHLSTTLPSYILVPKLSEVIPLPKSSSKIIGHLKVTSLSYCKNGSHPVMTFYILKKSVTRKITCWLHVQSRYLGFMTIVVSENKASLPRHVGKNWRFDKESHI